MLTKFQCSHEENFDWLNQKDDGKTAVRIANPKTFEFQVVRTTIIPGLLKTVRENRSHPLPLSIFEVGDIVVKDPTRERQTRNVRHASAVWCNKTAGFEVVHGLLDRAMKMLEVPRIRSDDADAATGYYLKETDSSSSVPLFSNGVAQTNYPDATYFPGRAATIYYREPPKKRSALHDIAHQIEATLHTTKFHDIKIGTIGILHPSVLEKFEIGFPCSALEFTLEPFKHQVHQIWTNSR